MEALYGSSRHSRIVNLEVNMKTKQNKLIRYYRMINHTFFKPRYCMRENGIALVMVLLLSVISLLFTGVMMQMVTSRSQNVGGHERYSNACEAARAGSYIIQQFLEEQAVPPMINDMILDAAYTYNVSMPIVAAGCLNTKLNQSTAAWGACNNGNTINSNNLLVDISFQLGGTADPLGGTTNIYGVYAKIIDTVRNASSNTARDKGLTVNPGTVPSSSEFSGQPIPALYTLKVLAVHQAGAVGRGSTGGEECSLTEFFQH